MTPNQRIGFLQMLCDKYGDFKVARAWKNSEGDMLWTKHRSVMECWHSQEGLQFLGRANNRTILIPEIVLDIDKEQEKNFKKILEELDSEGYQYRAYFSGSRGYHIHLIFHDIHFYSKYHREQLRQGFIEKFGTDALKKSEGAMIALEFTPHWKTGNPKVLIKTNVPGDDCAEY